VMSPCRLGCGQRWPMHWHNTGISHGMGRLTHSIGYSVPYWNMMSRQAMCTRRSTDKGNISQRIEGGPDPDGIGASSLVSAS
jgi:hypothetical protein